MAGSRIEGKLAEARALLGWRPSPAELDAAIDRGALVVDIRPESFRVAEGELPGAVVIERNVLEWRLDPTSESRLREVNGPDVEVVVVCNEGYASSLAAADLRALGLTRATDLDGGYRAWARHRARA